MTTSALQPAFPLADQHRFVLSKIKDRRRLQPAGTCVQEKVGERFKGSSNFIRIAEIFLVLQ